MTRRIKPSFDTLSYFVLCILGISQQASLIIGESLSNQFWYQQILNDKEWFDFMICRLKHGWYIKSLERIFVAVDLIFKTWGCD